jgi:hypothetical protein
MPISETGAGSLYGGASSLAPSPAYSGNPATGSFVPEIWSGKLIEKFYSATVLAAIANTDYEGEIRNMGDKVKIRTKPTITIRPYTLDQNLLVDRPSSSTVELQINFAFYFNEVLDDIMELQADMNLLSMWADDASEQLKITIDTQVLAGMAGYATGVTVNGPGGGSPTNPLGTIAAANVGAAAGKITAGYNMGASAAPIALTPSNALDFIVDAGSVLDEQNIPETGRWMIIPAWLAGMIKKSDLRNASISGDGVSLMRNGRLGMIDRFTLYASNLLPLGTAGVDPTATAIFAGHPHGLTFASQISKVETLRSEQTFGTLLRGLQVFGAQILDGIALVELWAIKG